MCRRATSGRISAGSRCDHFAGLGLRRLRRLRSLVAPRRAAVRAAVAAAACAGLVVVHAGGALRIGMSESRTFRMQRRRMSFVEVAAAAA